MSKGGIIIRLIDIVLLLLFGFLIVSEVNRKSPVKLPQSDVKVKREITEEELLIIGIRADKSLYLEGENRIVPSLTELYNLITIRNQSFESLNRKFRVRIRSEWNLPIKYTMQIANFCRKNNIPVGMDIHNVSYKSSGS
ncbi:biopolymer transporter ExbD [candidate division KSB1 bacterium]|nr:biopolymer transporter ExbD [candidate division KSB1 bacterium]